MKSIEQIFPEKTTSDQELFRLFYVLKMYYYAPSSDHFNPHTKIRFNNIFLYTPRSTK
jgi:hypothetical protein